jgi:NDP-sugar pyrophosphorylase family protein
MDRIESWAKVKAIILAAGCGTRLRPLTHKTSKCLIQIGDKCLLEHILLALHKCGVSNAAIVVGYCADQIKRRISDYHYGIEIRYITNPFYDFHGSQYSLSLAEDELKDTDTLIVEGDILLHHKLVNLLLDNQRSDSVLVDTRKTFDATRSVIVLGRSGIVEEFVYDPTHKNVFDAIDDRSRIVGESLQVWKFSFEGSKALAADLHYYKEGLGGTRDFRTNLYSINRVIRTRPMQYVDNIGLPWRNINTIEDVEAAKSLNFER